MSFKRFVHDIQHSTFIAEALEVKYLSTNKTNRSITISINGNVYEYEFHDGPLWDVEQRFKKMLSFSQGKALQWIKNQADDYTKIASAKNESVFRVWYTNPDGGERYSDIEASDKEDAKDKFRKSHPMAGNGMYKVFNVELREDAPVNAVGSGNIAGAAPGEDPPVRKKFAGAPVFEVDHDKLWKSRFGKHPRHRYSRYVGEDDLGSEIKDYAKKNPKSSIILKNKSTGEMVFLRRRSPVKEMALVSGIASELRYLTGADKVVGTIQNECLHFVLDSAKTQYHININIPDVDQSATIQTTAKKKPALTLESDIWFGEPKRCAEDIVDSILEADQGYFDEL
jgi:hypothetical protein